MDAAVYIRPCQGGFLWGVYEEDPSFFDMKVLGPAFDVKDMPLDIEVLRRAAEEVKAQLPFLQTAKTREFRGGNADPLFQLSAAPGARCPPAPPAESEISGIWLPRCPIPVPGQFAWTGGAVNAVESRWLFP
jgi:hypothetical protein